METINKLATQNAVHIQRVPGPSGIEDNEIEDGLADEGTSLDLSHTTDQVNVYTKV